MSERPRKPKTGAKTAATTAVMVSPLNGAKVPVGAHPKNTGGKKGRSGRRPDDVLKWLRSLYDEDTVREQFQAVLEDRNHPHWAKAFFSGLEHVKGRPTQRIEVADKTPQMLETGEALVHRIATVMFPRFAVLLQHDQRLRMLQDIAGAETVVTGAESRDL